MGKHMHRLSDVDLEARTGVCETCGPVTVWIGGNGGGKPACSNRCREWKRKSRSKRKDRLRKYGLTLTEWDRLLIEHSGRCAICSSPMEDPNIDHCHASLAVRGLLCRSCNLGLGNFEDDVRRLEAAIDYLKK